MIKNSKNSTKTRKIGSFLALLSFTAYLPISCAQVFALDANALPVLSKAINGSTATSGNTMNVSVTSTKAGAVGQFDWNSFNVGKNKTVNFKFSANNQTALNRVIGNGASEIYGKLTQSGSHLDTSKVILINPNGVLFGQGSNVNLNSFTASTKDIFGAKNLQDMKDADLNTYANNLANGGIAGNNTDINFVSDTSKGSGKITIKKGDERTIFNVDKTFAMVGDVIDINNSDITTNNTKSNIKLITSDGVTFKYDASGYATKVKSNTSDKTNGGITITDSTIKTGDIHITADNGDVKINDEKRFDITSAGNINIKGKNVAISSGEWDNHQGLKADGNINITATNGSANINDFSVVAKNIKVDAKNINVLKTNMVASEDLNLYGNNTNFTGSLAEYKNLNFYRNVNGKETINNVKINGNSAFNDIDGVNGNKGIHIKTTGNLTVEDTGLKQKIYGDETKTMVNQKAITLESTTGNVTVTAANITTGSNFTVRAAKNVTIQGGTVKDYTSNQKDITMSNLINGDVKTKYNKTNITANNGTLLVQANGNATVKTSTLTAKNITANADTINIQGESNLSTTGNIKLYGKNTTIDNSSLKYNLLKFYDSTGKESTKVNNVTLKNNAKFNRTLKDNNYLGFATNGDLTVDNTDLYSDDMTKAGKKGLILDGKNVTVKNTKNLTANNGNIRIKATEDANIKAANISTTGGVYVEKSKNTNISDKSNINATNISITADNDVTVNSSKVWAKGGDVKVTATNGKITVKSDDKNNVAKILATSEKDKNGKIVKDKDGNIVGGRVTLDQKADMNLNEDFKNSVIGGETKLTLKSNGNIEGGSSVFANQSKKITEINKTSSVVTLNDTTNNNTFAVGSEHADIIAGKDIEILYLKSAQNINFKGKNVTLKKKSIANDTSAMNLKNISTESTNKTTVATNDDLILNNFEIKNDSTKGKLTSFYGKSVKTYQDSAIGGKIVANQNKVAISSPGVINVKVSGITDAKNGLDVNASVNTGSTGSENGYKQDALEGRKVTINAEGEALAISKIKAETLTLNAKEYIAGETTISAAKDHVAKDKTETRIGTNPLTETEAKGKGYIEVSKEGKFNLDDSAKYNNPNSKVEYTGGNFGSTSLGGSDSTGSNGEYTYNNNDSSIILDDGSSELADSDIDITNKTIDGEIRYVGKYVEEGRLYQVYERYIESPEKNKNSVTTQYLDKLQRTTGESKKDNQHIVTLNNKKDQKNGFVLIYDKKTGESTYVGNNDIILNTYYVDISKNPKN